MDENHYTSLEAITVLVHALDYVCAEYIGYISYTHGELLSWYLTSQQFLVDHILQEFIK